jgi:hypothetical protein
MVHYLVKIICWNHSHMNEIQLTRKQAIALPNKVECGKAVCPDCRNDGLGNQPFEIIESPALLYNNSIKPYKCRHGHMTTISAFAHDMFHVRFGANRQAFENVSGKLEELEEMIDNKEIVCNHTLESGKQCSCKLVALDNVSLDKPYTMQFKTKTRVGDIWDKAGLEPGRPAVYDRDGNVAESKTDKANRARLNAMRSRNRNVSEDRLPGKVIHQSSDTRYRRRDKNSIDFS